MNAVRWGTICGMLVLHFVVDFLCPRIAFQMGSTRLPQVIVLGICVAQVNLIAVWAVLAGGRWIVRLPWAALLAMLMWFGLSLGNRLHPDNVHVQRFSADTALLLGLVLLSGMLVAQVPLWVARVAFGWRLQTPRRTRENELDESQFQIIHIIIGTTLLAIACAFGRLVLPPGEIRLPQLDHELPVLLPVVAICNLAITIPCNWAAFASKHVVAMFALVGIVYVIGLSIAEVFVLSRMLGGAPKEVWWLMIVFNWAQFATVFATLLLLRSLGFALLRRTRKPPVATAVLPVKS